MKSSMRVCDANPYGGGNGLAELGWIFSVRMPLATISPRVFFALVAWVYVWARVGVCKVMPLALSLFKIDFGGVRRPDGASRRCRRFFGGQGCIREYRAPRHSLLQEAPTQLVSQFREIRVSFHPHPASVRLPGTAVVARARPVASGLPLLEIVIVQKVGKIPLLTS